MPFTDTAKQRASARQWYSRNKDTVKANVQDRKNQIRDWMEELKSTLSCNRCPESHPACLDFHHRDESQKEFEVSNAVLMGRSIKRIKEEIAKCEVLCANCHRKHHYDQRNSPLAPFV